MIQSVYKTDFRDPKQIIELWKIPNADKLKSNLFEQRKPISDASTSDHKLPETKSKINIASSVCRQMERESGIGKKVSCSCLSSEINQSDDESLSNLKKKEKPNQTRCSIDVLIPRREAEVCGPVFPLCCGPDEMLCKRVVLPKRKPFREEPRSRDNECYESRMFNYPFINQIVSRVKPTHMSTQLRRNLSEYNEGIGRIGSIVVKHKLHDHSKCGKEGRKCEHRLGFNSQMKSR